MKRILIFVDPKGSGKSTICSLLETELRIKFAWVEPLFLKVRAELGSSHPNFERIGYQRVPSCLQNKLAHSDTLYVESTGVSQQLRWVFTVGINL